MLDLIVSKSHKRYIIGYKTQHVQENEICWAPNFKLRALISTKRGGWYLDQPPWFVPGRVRATTEAGAE